MDDKVDIEETDHEVIITIDTHGVGRAIADAVVSFLASHVEEEPNDAE